MIETPKQQAPAPGSEEAQALNQRDTEALDAYSSIVTQVADALLPSIASVEPLRADRNGRRRGGGGSAVVITPDGFLLTSAHVVAGSERGRALLTDGRDLEYMVAGRDPLSDLALLRAASDDLDAATLGDAERLRTGQLVVAMGSPLGFAGSVSAGVVSALGRSFPTHDGRVGRIIDNVIQTDVALHPGNSGGALANSRSEVVGINTAVVGSMIGPGLGLAVPINTAARRIIGALMHDGRVRRGFLGIAGGTRPLPPRVAAEVGQPRGVEIAEVTEGSPAQRAGLWPGDIITRLDGHVVDGAGSLQALLTEEAIGSTLEVRILRGNQQLSLSIAPIELNA